jgi:putative membrane protein
MMLIRIFRFTRTSFWREAATVRDSAAVHVMPGVLLFGLIAVLMVLVEVLTPEDFTLGIEVTAFEVGGAVLSMLLVLRLNEGLARWNEGRRLWGGINNQCRSLAIAGLAYGPADLAWRRALVHWTISFAHVCRRSLRDERTLPEVAKLVGEAETERIAEARHMPSHVALVLARILQTGLDRLGLDRFAYIQADKERALLIDHIGGCERILTTPIPRMLSVQIRRFLLVFLIMLPLGLIPKFHHEGHARIWLVPFITVIVAFPLLALDRIGSELQKPFWVRSLNDLKLDTYTTNIEKTLLALLDGPAAGVEIAEFLVDFDASANGGGREVAAEVKS